MRLYSAGDIVKKLRGVTARQILDIAEKGLVTPVRETTGAGSPRLYDFQNIFEICLCLAVRGKIPAKPAATQDLVVKILKHIQDVTKKHQKLIKNNQSRKLKTFVKLLQTREEDRFYFNKTEVITPPPPPPFDLLIISYDDRNNFIFYEASNKDSFTSIFSSGKKYMPQNYCLYVIEVKRLWEFLNSVF